MKLSKWIVLALTFVFFFIFFIGCQSKESRTIPGELRGVWKTSTPKYEDCYFELTEDQIIFINENYVDKTMINSVSNIEKKIQGKRIFYTIDYHDHDDLEYELSFYYDPTGGSIRYKNQQEIEWKKTKNDEY